MEPRLESSTPPKRERALDMPNFDADKLRKEIELLDTQSPDFTKTLIEKAEKLSAALAEYDTVEMTPDQSDLVRHTLEETSSKMDEILWALTNKAKAHFTDQGKDWASAPQFVELNKIEGRIKDVIAKSTTGRKWMSSGHAGEGPVLGKVVGNSSRQ